MALFRVTLFTLFLPFYLVAQPLDSANNINLWRGYLATNYFYEIVEFTRHGQTVLCGFEISNRIVKALNNCIFAYSNNTFYANSNDVKIKYEDHEYLNEDELKATDMRYKKSLIFTLVGKSTNWFSIDTTRTYLSLRADDSRNHMRTPFSQKMTIAFVIVFVFICYFTTKLIIGQR